MSETHRVIVTCSSGDAEASVEVDVEAESPELALLFGLGDAPPKMVEQLELDPNDVIMALGRRLTSTLGGLFGDPDR